MTRIAIGGFQHESHSFAPRPTAWMDFIKPGGFPPLQHAATLLDALRPTAAPCAGAIAVAEAEGIEIAPLAWAFANPAGPVTREAFERITALILAALSDAMDAGPLDGVYLELHGAMVSEDFPDAEGEVLRRAPGPHKAVPHRRAVSLRRARGGSDGGVGLNHPDVGGGVAACRIMVLSNSVGLKHTLITARGAFESGWGLRAKEPSRRAGLPQPVGRGRPHPGSALRGPAQGRPAHCQSRPGSPAGGGKGKGRAGEGDSLSPRRAGRGAPVGEALRGAASDELQPWWPGRSPAPHSVRTRPTAAPGPA